MINRIVAVFLVTSLAHASSLKKIDHYLSQKTKREDLIAGINQIRANKRTLSELEAAKIAKAAVEAGSDFGIPSNLILAISFVESSYNVAAKNLRSNDFGIMQVNSWHIKRYKLNKKKLTTDLTYSFFWGTKVFSWFYKKYPLDEAIARYNCGTREKCPSWSSVRQYVKKIKKAL